MNISFVETMDELVHVEQFYEFSPDSKLEVQEYLLDHDLVELVEDTVMVTYAGELALGYSKEELKDFYDDVEMDHQFDNELIENEGEEYDF